MKILMLETMTYGDDISLEQFNRLGEVVTYSLSSYEEAVARMKEHNPDVVIINKTNMNAECMAAAPNLKMVAEAATLLCGQRPIRLPQDCGGPQAHPGDL